MNYKQDRLRGWHINFAGKTDKETYVKMSDYLSETIDALTLDEVEVYRILKGKMDGTVDFKIALLSKAILKLQERE